MVAERWPWRWGERTLVMGVVNTDPDSFSGDGVGTADQAQWLGAEMASAGADIIDVGGESTRPGGPPVDDEEQIRRVQPAVRAICAAVSVPVSVDTSSAAVAEAALDAGAAMVNDVRGLRSDPAMAALCAARGVPVVVTHNQRGRASSGDVVADIRAGLGESLAIADDAGIRPEDILVDPGFGFGWTVEQNLEMVRRLGELRDLGHPLLIGLSRKSTIGAVLGDRPVGERLHGSLAAATVAVANGVDVVRAHDVAATVDTVRMADAIVRTGAGRSPLGGGCGGD